MLTFALALDGYRDLEDSQVWFHPDLSEQGKSNGDARVLSHFIQSLSCFPESRHSVQSLLLGIPEKHGPLPTWRLRLVLDRRVSCLELPDSRAGHFSLHH